MSFPAYPAYKGCGVEWLGNIPTDWEVRPFWSHFRRIKALGYPDEVLLSVYRDHGVIVKSSRDDNFNKASEDLSSYQLVSEGNLAMNKMKAWQGSLGISAHRGIVSPAYFVFDKLTDDNPRFLNYLLRSKNYATAFMTISKGIRVNQWDVDPDQLRLLPLIIPPRADQRAIAAFLDRETAKIDAAVAAQERLIALLAEKRAATISHAVTKGLDPDAPMKDSGIEWLGHIPAHWDVKRLKFLSTKIGSGVTPRGGADAYVDRGIRFLRSQNVYDEGLRLGDLVFIDEETHASMSGSAVEEGDILINITGASIGRTALAAAACLPANVNQHVCIIRLADDRLRDHVAMYMKSLAIKAQIDAVQNGAAREGLNFEQLGEMQVPLPPEDERDEIGEALRDFCKKSDRMMADSKRSIRLLKERRAALISAAVTGKIDVRGEVTADNVVSLDEYRAAVGAVAIAKLGKMGRMAVMKAGYLAEAYAGMRELQGHYERNAAGPYCSNVVRGMERGAADRHGITVRESEGKASYDLPASFEVPAAELRDRFGIDRADRFLSLVTELSGFSREGVEAIATLYAAWNDLLARDGDITEDAVYREVLDNWHSEKREKFNTDTLAHWMDWMRRNGVVPDGTAPRTDHQAGLDL